jgi:hypothetical protein
MRRATELARRLRRAYRPHWGEKAGAISGACPRQDGDGVNSPFVTALASYLEEPGLELQFLFRKVRDRVIAQTGGSQEPFLYGSLGAEALYFAAK